MHPHHDSFETQRRRLGLPGASVAAAGLAGLLPSVFGSDLPPAAVFTGNVTFLSEDSYGYISWDPFSDYAGGESEGYLVASFACEGQYLYLRAGEDFGFSFQLADSCGSLALLAPGYTVTAGDFWASIPSGSIYDSPLVTNGGSLYFGYRIDIGDGDYAYGWAHFEEVDGGVQLSHWGINTVDNQITISLGEAIPEPSTYAAITGLFFAGVVAFSRWKKRRALAA